MSLLETLSLNCADLSARLAGARVLVVGDVMLDRYWFGEVNRISPEAPVPVAKITRIEERAGGAANVARNIAALGGQASLLSVVGDDEAASALETLLLRDGIATSLRRDPSISTPTKLRVVARQQQLIRIDFEEAPSHEILADKLDDFAARLAQHDVVILSDYGKGGLTHVARMVERVKGQGVPLNLAATTFYFNREMIITGGDARMFEWQKSLYAFLSRNASPVKDYYRILPTQIIEIGLPVQL